MSVGRQFGLAAAGGDPKLKLPLVAAVPPVASRQEAARETLAAKPSTRETKTSGETKIGRGRPRKHPVEPWIAEGVSKATWHRRQKAKNA